MDLVFESSFFFDREQAHLRNLWILDEYGMGDANHGTLESQNLPKALRKQRRIKE